MAQDASNGQGVQVGSGNVQYNNWQPRPRLDPVLLATLNPDVAMARLQALPHDEVVDFFAGAAYADVSDILETLLTTDREYALGILTDISQRKQAELAGPLLHRFPWLARLPGGRPADARAVQAPHARHRQETAGSATPGRRPNEDLGSELMDGADDGLSRYLEGIREDQLSTEARAELAALPAKLASDVGRMLVAAELESDPERARFCALAARELAGNVGLVREVAGIAAYRTGRWAEALRELTAGRRLTGRLDYLPVIADCERGLGRLDRALEIARSPEARHLPRTTQIELRIVESGILRDQRRPDAAVRALQVHELTEGRSYPFSARLFYAYAEALLASGHEDEALRALKTACLHDPNGETDAVERIEEISGHAQVNWQP